MLSIQVALLACVRIGSLAQLSFSFCKWSLLASCRGVDVFLGNVITSTGIVWLQKSIAIPNSFMVSTKNEVMLGLLSLLYLTASCSN